MRILFTGFDPFGGEKINPAGEAVKMMKNEIQGAEILKLEVPTVFGKAGEVLKKAVEQYRPDAVVCVGQAGGRAAIRQPHTACRPAARRPLHRKLRYIHHGCAKSKSPSD